MVTRMDEPLAPVFKQVLSKSHLEPLYGSTVLHMFLYGSYFCCHFEFQHPIPEIMVTQR